MRVWRYEHPPAVVIADEDCVEIIDAQRSRRVVLRNRLASEARRLVVRGPASDAPLFDSVVATADVATVRSLQILRQAAASSYDAETCSAPPGQLWIELTSQCNEHCIHCYADSGPQRREFLDRDTVLRVVREAAQMRFAVIQFTGGDPLLSPFLIEATRTAVEAGIRTVEVFTNGLRLRGALCDDLVALKTCFALSFYSHDPETHDRITRVPGSQRATAAAIRRLLARGAAVRVGIIEMRENEGHVSRTREYLESLGVDPARIRCDSTHSVGRGGDAAPARTRVRESALPAADEPGAHGAALQGSGKLAIAPDGTAYPCIFQRWLPLGNVERHSLESLYRRRTVTGSMAPDEAFDHCCDRIACADCRVSAYLGTRASGPRSQPKVLTMTRAAVPARAVVC